MNTEESFDIPIGEDNYLETDYPNLDLSTANVPTHFDVFLGPIAMFSALLPLMSPKDLILLTASPGKSLVTHLI
ncbi:MAG: hypothetical protein CM1200mP40_12600 [Gammaproteobacteria bacterium]|nr:MAG: hypothetical protein CM1200mP40_12600 [Gammaproteobacteria bacterium]